MTIAISVKVHDGVVLGADSASTLMARSPDGSTGVLGVYNHANKIVNLHKGLPLGVVTWGAGAIGSISMTTLFKDFRAILTGEKQESLNRPWKIDPAQYSIADVAEQLKTYVVERYAPEFSDWPEPPYLGMIVAGYSSDGSNAEVYQIDIEGPGAAQMVEKHPGDEGGLTAAGMPNAISRLIFGVDPSLPQVFVDALGSPVEQALAAVELIKQHLSLPVIQPAMPVQDAIDLAHFLVDLTIKTAHFVPGPDTVGGAIEIAAITKHEGFKWVSRKHYFDRTYNP